MSKALSELQAVLGQMLIEQRRLLKLLESHQSAMKKFDLKTMAISAQEQEASRTRLVSLDSQRRALASKLALECRIPGEVTLAGLAKIFPGEAVQLLQLRREMRETIDAIRQRTYVSSRVANAVLGHVNTTLRIFASAMQRAGLYTKAGSPKIAGRIGVMDAVG